MIIVTVVRLAISGKGVFFVLKAENGMFVRKRWWGKVSSSTWFDLASKWKTEKEARKWGEKKGFLVKKTVKYSAM